jgi:hypothetical protein
VAVGLGAVRIAAIVGVVCVLWPTIGVVASGAGATGGAGTGVSATIYTVVGGGAMPLRSDAVATDVQLPDVIRAVAIGPNGDLLLEMNHALWWVRHGRLARIAGGAWYGAITVDRQGRPVVAHANEVVRIERDGSITKLARNGECRVLDQPGGGYTGEGGPARAASLARRAWWCARMGRSS